MTKDKKEIIFVYQILIVLYNLAEDQVSHKSLLSRFILLNLMHSRN